MKRTVLFLVSFIIVAFSALGKDYISFDKQETDSTRTIMSYSVLLHKYKFTSTWPFTSLSLCYTTNNILKEGTWGLRLEIIDHNLHKINKDHLLLIKLKNGEVLYARCLTDVDNLHFSSSYSDKHVSGQIAYPFYYFAVEDILKLISNEIIKVRIETTCGYIEYNEFNKKLPQRLTTLYNAIRIRSQKSNSILDNF